MGAALAVPRSPRFLPAASDEAYAVACIELYRRLWVELDALFATDDSVTLNDEGSTTGSRLQILRLELVLLLDACRSARWRLQLDFPQRLSLQSIVGEVLDVLNSSSEALPRDGIAWAQDRLLDAVLDHCAACSNPFNFMPGSF